MKIARVVDIANRTLVVTQQSDGRLLRLEGEPMVGTARITDEVVEERQWLPPVDPRAIICIGLNYRKHAIESGLPIPAEPVVFMKNTSAAIGHQEAIRIPAVCGNEIDYEGELAVVIGKACCNVSKEDVPNYVLGCTIANDVSSRIWQFERGGSQWVRSKSYDTFAPLGPVLVTMDELADLNDLAIKTTLNGQVVQHSTTADMIFDVASLVAFLSQDTTLLPGTVILTGTPEGIGWTRKPRLLLNPGDVVSIEIERIGCLVNTVR